MIKLAVVLLVVAAIQAGKQVESVFKDFRRGRLTIGQMEKRIKDIVKGLVDAQAW